MKFTEEELKEYNKLQEHINAYTEGLVKFYSTLSDERILELDNVSTESENNKSWKTFRHDGKIKDERFEDFIFCVMGTLKR